MDADKRKTLDEAWEIRKELWKKGSAKIVQANKEWEEIKSFPGTSRIGLWYGVSEASAHAADLTAEGYTTRLDADKIWHDAVVSILGEKTKVTWGFDDAAKGYDCVLDNGEVFKA